MVTGKETIFPLRNYCVVYYFCCWRRTSQCRSSFGPSEVFCCVFFFVVSGFFGRKKKQTNKLTGLIKMTTHAARTDLLSVHKNHHLNWSVARTRTQSWRSATSGAVAIVVFSACFCLCLNQINDYWCCWLVCRC